MPRKIWDDGEIRDSTPEEDARDAAETVTFPPLTARQIRLGLLRAGKSPSLVEQVIASLPEPAKSEAEIFWEYSAQYHRDHPLLIQVGQALGLTDAEMDAMWRDALLT